MKRHVFAVFVPVSVIAMLAGCSSSTPAPAASPAASTRAASTAAASPSTAAAAPSTPASAPTSAPAASGVITINKEVDDSVMGVKVTIIQAVRGFKPLAAALSNDEMVVVQVKMDATKNPYATTMGPDSFTFSTSANKFGMNATAMPGVPEWMTANGYPPLVAAKPGQVQTGWVAGILKPAGDPAPVINYYQLAFQDNKGGVFPRKDYPVTIK